MEHRPAEIRGKLHRSLKEEHTRQREESVERPESMSVPSVCEEQQETSEEKEGAVSDRDWMFTKRENVN